MHLDIFILFYSFLHHTLCIVHVNILFIKKVSSKIMYLLYVVPKIFKILNFFLKNRALIT